MTSFTRQPNPIWLFVDLNGKILDDTYYAHFLQNVFPYLPQPVYQDAAGAVSWPNPLQFYANGTLPDNLYFAEGQTYRIEIRQGSSQADPLIYLIQNFVPLSGGTSDGITIPTDNQITNPEFAYTSFTNDYVIANTLTNTYEIAPGWQLILEGSATMTLTQLTFAGNDKLNGNPGYGIRFAISSGIFTSVKLVQRFNHAPAIYASTADNDTYVSISLLGRSNDANRIITVNYIPSNGAAINIIRDTLIQGVFNTISNAEKIDPSTSTHTGDNGYVDISFSLPEQGSYDLSAIQLVGSSQDNQYPYTQDTVERQTDYLFHLYKEAVVQQPKSNLLTGWNFGLNPWQFQQTASIAIVDNRYTADQTIIVQQNYVDANVGSNIAVGRASYTDNYAFEVIPQNGTNKFAMVQYIDAATIRPYWGEKLSALVRAYLVTAHTTTCRFKCKLIYRASVPPTIARDEPISAWTVSTEPTFKAGWTAINALNDPTYTLGGNVFEFAFDQFELPESTNDLMTLGIVIYTLDDLNSASTADDLYIQDVSLVHNDYAIEAAPETVDETLKKCQYYYQKSYSNAALAGTSTANGAYFAEQLETGTSPISLFAKSFSFSYQAKRSTSPAITFYANNGVINNVTGFITNNGSFDGGTIVPISNWTQSGLNEKSVIYLANSTVAIHTLSQAATLPEGYINYQWIADARLGLVV